MTMPQRTLGLSIVLAILLVQHVTCSTNASTEDPNPYKQYTGNDDKYEVIDVADQQKGDADNHVQTGQTLRIFASGEVNDDFWLKHLGEDFKDAIHMQVGNDQYNGVFNMTEGGSKYAIHHDYDAKDMPVEGSTGTDSDATWNSTMPRRAESENAQRMEKPGEVDVASVGVGAKANESKNETNVGEYYERPYEHIFAIDDDNNAVQFLQSFYNRDQANETSSNNNKNKYTKNVHQVNVKYTPPYQETQHKPGKTKKVKATSYQNAKVQYSPVVVTLPERHNVLQFNEKEVPVVVKMPPVIYHHNPAYDTDIHQQAQLTVPHYTHDTDTQYTHYPQPLSQQQQQHEHYSQYTQNYYNPIASPYEEASYNNNNNNNAGVTSEATYPSVNQGLNEKVDDPAVNLRYIMPKSTPTYSSDVTSIDSSITPPQTPQDATFNSYSRDSRSNQDLFNEGL